LLKDCFWAPSSDISSRQTEIEKEIESAFLSSYYFQTDIEIEKALSSFGLKICFMKERYEEKVHMIDT